MTRGHSTLTVNDEMHLADGRVPLLSADLRSGYPVYTFDLTPLYGDNLLSAKRTFSRNGSSLMIRDELYLSEKTRKLSWQMLTRASVKVKDGELVLGQDGREMHVYLRSDQPFEARVVDLSPPPLPYDKDIADLKRIELSFERAVLTDSCEILIELKGSH